MTESLRSKLNRKSIFSQFARRFAGMAAVILIAFASNSAQAQGDIRYSWFEISYVGQDVSKSGSRLSLIAPGIPQIVDIETTDGTGVMFRGSMGTWHNLYAFVDFSSSDIAVVATITNTITGEQSAPAKDEFDFTTIRGGIGYKYQLRIGTDLFGEVSYESLDLDFGSFVGGGSAESFDTNAQDFGGKLGIRTLFGDQFEGRAFVRYTNVGNVDLSNPPGGFDSDTLFGIGAGYEVVRGLAITADFETGEFTNWNIGFRLDLDEK